MKTVDIKGKAYVEVNERLIEFRTNPKYKGYTLETDIIQLENGICTMKATIKDDTSRVIATGYAQEKENSSFINKTSYIENCETSAWGRALGNLGIGIDTSIASAEEVLNAMQNQKSQAVEPQRQQKPDVNPDADIIAGLEGISDVQNLEIYYYENLQKVKDEKAFNKAVNKRKKEINV